MSRIASIPSKHEQRVVNWWLFGQSPREIAARLLEEHKVETSYSSVQRLIDRVSQGHSAAAMSAVKARLRLETGQIVTELADLRTRVLVVAGVSPGSTQVGSVESLRELRGLDVADRVLHRKLKVAGVESKDTYEELQLQARAEKASTLAGVRDGLDYWIEPNLASSQGPSWTRCQKTRPATPWPEASEAEPPRSETARSETSNPSEFQPIESCAPVPHGPVQVPEVAPSDAVPVSGRDAAEGPVERARDVEPPEASTVEPPGAPANEDVDEGGPIDERVIALNVVMTRAGTPTATGRAAGEADSGPGASPIGPVPASRGSTPVSPTARRRPANVTEGLLWARQAEEERLRAAGPSNKDRAARASIAR